MARCPECGATIKLGSFLPFCSERCRCIDLSRWLREDFVISAPFQENERVATNTDRPSPDAIVDASAYQADSEADH